MGALGCCVVLSWRAAARVGRLGAWMGGCVGLGCAGERVGCVHAGVGCVGVWMGRSEFG